MHRDEYLEELIRLEGRGDSPTTLCSSCPPGSEAGRPLYRCRDCFSTDLVCQTCCVEAHKNRPLDIIEVRKELILIEWKLKMRVEMERQLLRARGFARSWPARATGASRDLNL